MTEHTQEFTPLKSTFSIDTSESVVPEEHRWEHMEGQPMVEEAFSPATPGERGDILSATPLVDVTDVLDVGLKAVELVGKWSKIVAKPESMHALPLEDPDGLNYLGETFRAPAKGVYKKLFWTDSLWPCGFFSFYFNITSKARPKQGSKVEDGYYISNISIVPVNAYAYPGCSLKATLHSSNPVRAETADGLAVAKLDLIVDMHLVKLGIFDWKSKIHFELSGDTCELKTVGETLPTPF